MAAELVQELVDAGIHFGHRASRWNPKMKPYIFGKRNQIHIVNVKETLRGLLLAKRFVTRVVSQGKDICIVGTKRQARKSVRENAEAVGMHWVIDRWLGGTLTNFREIRRRIARLEELEQMEADGLLDAYSKKQGASLRREIRKITRNLGGIRKMEKLPGALVVIDQKREIIAVREARKMKIPVICLLDTDSDPDLVDIAIPGNDDAMRGIDLIVREICAAAQEGLNARTERDTGEDRPAPRRRSRRPAMARAAETEGTQAPAPPAGTSESEAPAAEEPQSEAPAAAESSEPAETPTPEPKAQPQTQPPAENA